MANKLSGWNSPHRLLPVAAVPQPFMFATSVPSKEDGLLHRRGSDRVVALTPLLGCTICMLLQISVNSCYFQCQMIHSDHHYKQN